MKKMVLWIALSIFAFFLAACANMATEEPLRVKCLSCGYEFEVKDPGDY